VIQHLEESINMEEFIASPKQVCLKKEYNRLVKLHTDYEELYK
jgi:hypothetical protein